MRLGESDIFSWFSKHQPDMTVEKITSQTERPGTVYLSSRILATGMYYIEANGEKYGYDLSILVPSTPDDFWLPVVLCNDEKLYSALNRHILSNSQACLGTSLDIIKKCGIGKNFDFESFILNVLEPFIAWQLYYDFYRTPAPWGERAHGVEGEFQSIADQLADVWNVSYDKAYKMLFGSGPKKTLRKKCFCGSGNTFFFCHGQLINLLRNKITQIKEKSANDYKIDSGKAMNELIGIVLDILYYHQ